MISPSRDVDRLIYAALSARTGIDWATGSASDHGHWDDCCGPECDALDNASDQLAAAVNQFRRYSDGRPIRSTIDVEPGHRFTHTWPPGPDPQPGPIELCRGELSRCDADRSRGTFIVWIHPADSMLHIEIVPTPRLELIR